MSHHDIVEQDALLMQVLELEYELLLKAQSVLRSLKAKTKLKPFFYPE